MGSYATRPQISLRPRSDRSEVAQRLLASPSNGTQEEVGNCCTPRGALQHPKRGPTCCGEAGLPWGRHATGAMPGRARCRQGAQCGGDHGRVPVRPQPVAHPGRAFLAELVLGRPPTHRSVHVGRARRTHEGTLPPTTVTAARQPFQDGSSEVSQLRGRICRPQSHRLKISRKFARTPWVVIASSYTLTSEPLASSARCTATHCTASARNV